MQKRTLSAPCWMVLILLAGLCGPSFGQVNEEELESGATLRVFHIGTALEQVAEPLPGVSPNVNRLISRIDLQGIADFAPSLSPSGELEFEDSFIAIVTGYLRVSESGAHAFRLTSDDGSLLMVAGKRVVWNRGVHAPISAHGALLLEPGLHPFKILFFENQGGQALRLEWKTPAADDFMLVPKEVLFTPLGVTRVVSPGTKRTRTQVQGLRAGDGVSLSSVHPSYVIDNLHGKDFNPMVGCMALLPDGRLLIGTFEPKNNGVWLTEPNGQLWVLDDLGDASGASASVTPKLFAADFYHPLGLAVVDQAVYVAGRDEITKLEDLDADGVYETRSSLASGWVSDNYHHFTFGLEHHEGFLYASLSTSIGSGTDEVLAGEIIGINGPNPPMRGTLMKIDIKSGAIEYICGGFRTPNGILVDGAGDVFVGENQGAWQPACRVNHARPGKFYGHYNETHARTESYPDGGHAALFASESATELPALWLPQNEVCNSPTDFLIFPSGVFEGQMLIGELKLGGIRRANLERVNGVLQGAVFRFSQGFEGGVNRLLWGPLVDGEPSLYVGCMGEQATWSWRGTRTGLQRMTPTKDDSTFEFHSIHASAEGFELRFTQPAKLSDLSATETYDLSQWHYLPVPDYGGSKVGLESLAVTSATPSADGLSVKLVVPGLKAGSCVYLRCDPAGSQGEVMWSPEAWYTLNEIPGSIRPELQESMQAQLLVFTKTAGYRHGAIEAGVEMIQREAANNGFGVTESEDATLFNDAYLARFQAVIFLSTTGNVLNLSQEAAFERFIRAGGGFVGVHSATDTEYDWPWYGKLVGAYFSGHPHIQIASLRVVDALHPATSMLPDEWIRADEWYNFRARPADGVRVLLTLDEASYEGGTMGEQGHPIAWCHAFDGGRAFYTELGHTSESYVEPLFVQHLMGGILWAMGADGPR